MNLHNGVKRSSYLPNFPFLPERGVDDKKYRGFGAMPNVCWEFGLEIATCS